MKRNLIAILGTALLCLLIVNVFHKPWVGGIFQGEIDAREDVTMTAVAATSTGAQFQIRNAAGSELESSPTYGLHVKKADGWHELIDLSFSHTLTLGVYPPDSLNALNLTWNSSYGTLPPGQYRIVKEFSFRENPDSAFLLAAEFTLD